MKAATQRARPGAAGPGAGAGPAWDEERLYRAVASRDRRFDGRFFLAVRTTGIYCRPGCPAPIPKRRHVRFFRSAAAAAAEGFRPCRRCRPEAAPGSPAARGTAATVQRALQLIDRGALDCGRVAELADRLGVGERHLRRLFEAHLGASPAAVAATRRLHFALRLLDETALPVTEVAFAAGFQSVRRFNAAVREAFGRPPRELRRARGVAPPGRDDPGAPRISLRLAARPPFDGRALLAFLADRAMPGAESVEGGRYRRLARVDGRPVAVEIALDRERPGVVLRAPTEAARGLGDLARRARRLFDLDADPRALGRVLGADPDLAPLLRRMPGVRVPGCWDAFELAVRAILGQQVSVPRATQLAGELARRFGDGPTEGGAGALRAFPRPEQLAEVDLAGLGWMPGIRAEAVRRLAAGVAAGELHLEAGPDPEGLRAVLRELPGVGPWTAELIAMRALEDPDAFPSADLGLRRAAERWGARPSPSALEERAEAWRPWRAYAAALLWRAEPA